MSSSLSTWTQRTDGPRPGPRTIYTGSTGDPCTAQENRPEHEKGQEAARSGTAGARLALARVGAAYGCGREGQARQGSASASKCLGPWLEQRFPLMAPCTGEGPYTKTRNSGEREAALVQTHRHQFSADSENTDQREGGIPVARPDLCPRIPVRAPSQPTQISHPETKVLPLPQQLSGCLWPMPTDLKRQSCPSSRATVPALLPPAL